MIDFGDITAGDPATDLAVAWMLLPVQHHAAFRAAYRAARTAAPASTQTGAPERTAPDAAGLDGAEGAALWAEPAAGR